MRRFDMRLPALVRLDENNEFQTETQNVSARGVFFYLDRPVPEGTACEVTLTFPPHITLTGRRPASASPARIIRSESPLPSARVGTAAMIEDYEFLRSTAAPISSAPCSVIGSRRTKAGSPLVRGPTQIFQFTPQPVIPSE